MPRRAGADGARSTAARRAKLRAFERAVAARADVSLFVSEAEAALFRAEAGRRRRRPRALQRHRSRFLRSRRPLRAARAPRAGPADRLHRPDGLRAQCRGGALVRAARCMPRPLPATRASPSSAASPTAAVRRLGRARGVIVTGEVADVRPWLAAADVVVAPLEIARGIQNKVLEAMAMARPVVASPGRLRRDRGRAGPRPARRRRRRGAGRGDRWRCSPIRSGPRRSARPPGGGWSRPIAGRRGSRRSPRCSASARAGRRHDAALAIAARRRRPRGLARASASRSASPRRRSCCSSAATPPTWPRSGGPARPSTIAC